MKKLHSSLPFSLFPWAASLQSASRHLLPFVVLSLLLSLSGCSKGGQTSGGGQNDSDSVAAPALCVADTLMNRTAAFYAGVSADGIQMSSSDAQAWKKYSEQIAKYRERSRESHLGPIDGVLKADAQDLREKVDYMFYPFAGADFQYPITLFPDADTYFLVGLENVGSPLGEVKTEYGRYEAYRKALDYYFRCSYFITAFMEGDLDNNELDGTLPVISMLMALNDCKIISVQHKQFTEQGSLADADATSKLVEVKFFKQSTPTHEQTLYFLSTNMKDSAFDPLFQKYLDTELPKHYVASFFKAASYLCHYGSFDNIRGDVLKYSKAVLQDDSGIAFKFFDQNAWSLQLYGEYVRPLKCFDACTYQNDLSAYYKEHAADIHKLPFRIGYSRPSNWMIARKK